MYKRQDLEMVKDAGSLYATVSVIIKGMGGYLLPQLLKSVTLESDGNITAEYTSDELQLGEQKFSEIDMDNPASQQQLINFIMMKLMFNTLSADDITDATQGRNYAKSPRGLAFWYLKNDLLYVKLNLPGIISPVSYTHLDVYKRQGFTREGVAVMPDAAKGAELTGSDMARWTGLTAADKRKELTSKPLPEMEITQEMRQTAFDNWETTDDHGMVIYGIAKDQNGKEYFMVKNSWGTSGKYKGIWYASKAFVAYKTMNILVHKDALPKEIAKKLGIK